MNKAILFLTLHMILFAGCMPQKSVDSPLRNVILESRSLQSEEGDTITYERGVIEVPLNRKTGSEQMWEVEFVRIKSPNTESSTTPPIFILRGGPGSDPATELLEDPGYYDYFLAPYVQIADVIIPGQRGLRTSGATRCEPSRQLSLEEALDDTIREAERRKALQACRGFWEQKGYDLTGFNVKEMAADVHDIAKALGYTEIQIIGQSFGSHWGMATIREYPDLIARATLSALEGPDHTYDMPSGVVNTLQRIAESAEASPELASVIPKGGLMAAYQELIYQTDITPISVSVKHPETNKDVTIELSGDDLRALAGGYTRGTTWRFIMPAWPIDILTLLKGDFSGGAEAILDDKLNNRLRDAAYYQIDCASGISAERGKQLRLDPGATLIGQTWEYYDFNCSTWDADLGDVFRSPFTTDVPALLIHGNWDTSTPYENAEEVRNYFTNHRFVHVEGGSHGAFREANEEVEGFRNAVHVWLESGNFQHIPEVVTLPKLQWRAFEN